VSKARFCKQM